MILTAPFFRGTAGATLRPLVRLALENAAGLHDEAVVYFQNGSTTGFDTKYDAYYLNGGNPAAIYAPVSGEKLSINCLPALTAKTDYTVPLVVNTTTAGTYTLNASELLHFPAGFGQERRHAQMRGAAVAGAGVIELAGLGFDRLHIISQVIHAHVAGRGDHIP